MFDATTHYLTIEEVAARLNVCDKTIRNRLKQRGDISPHVARKIGRRWRFSEDVFSSPIALAG